MRKIFAVVTIVLLSFFLWGCGTGVQNNNMSQEHQSAADIKNEDAVNEDFNPAEIKANEVGKVMILMYHVIGSQEEKPWMQTADNFRRDLQKLYEQGYSLISLHDFLDNNINVPAGRTPLILTFDDGTAGHFAYLPGNEDERQIDPNCAVGILLEFGERYPGLGHAATFYINDRPFKDSRYGRMMKHLVELGFDIGNHTLTHPKLNKLAKEQVGKELAGLVKMVTKFVPDYQIRTLALPFGIAPQNRDWAAAGSYDGVSYRHDAVLLVGARPSAAPNTKGYDPQKLPRVQASTEELTKWLEYFQKHPEERYISDGNPDTISLPEDKIELLDHDTLINKKLVIWSCMMVK